MPTARYISIISTDFDRFHQWWSKPYWTGKVSKDILALVSDIDCVSESWTLNCYGADELNIVFSVSQGYFSCKCEQLTSNQWGENKTRQKVLTCMLDSPRTMLEIQQNIHECFKLLVCFHLYPSCEESSYSLWKERKFVSRRSRRSQGSENRISSPISLPNSWESLFDQLGLPASPNWLVIEWDAWCLGTILGLWSPVHSAQRSGTEGEATAGSKGRSRHFAGSWHAE